jgi:hypothetical protein
VLASGEYNAGEIGKFVGGAEVSIGGTGKDFDLVFSFSI